MHMHTHNMHMHMHMHMRMHTHMHMRMHMRAGASRVQDAALELDAAPHAQDARGRCTKARGR